MRWVGPEAQPMAHLWMKRLVADTSLETHLQQQGTISSSLQLVGGHNQELEMGYELSY